MPKLKSKRGAVKRFKLTGSGRIKRQRAFGSHILTSKPPKRKRRLKQPDLVSPSDQKRIKRLILA